VNEAIDQLRRFVIMKSDSSLTKPAEKQADLATYDAKDDVLCIIRHPLNPIQIYAAELWDALAERDTAITYKQALIKTWKLLKYLLALVFFMFLLGTAVIISIWGIAYNLGVSLQKWLNNDGQGRTPEEFFLILVNAFIAPFKKVVEWANDYVKKYLSINNS
jgi:hypothetical protein